MKKCVKPDVITVYSFRLPTLRERVEEHTRDGMDTLYICPDAWVLRHRFVNRETGETIRARCDSWKLCWLRGSSVQQSEMVGAMISLSDPTAL